MYSFNLKSKNLKDNTMDNQQETKYLILNRVGSSETTCEAHI